MTNLRNVKCATKYIVGWASLLIIWSTNLNSVSNGVNFNEKLKKKKASKFHFKFTVNFERRIFKQFLNRTCLNNDP